MDLQQNPAPQQFTCRICGQGVLVNKECVPHAGPAVVIGYIFLIHPSWGYCFAP